VATAAIEVLRERGLVGYSIEEVARHSGVSKPTIYSRWRSRAEVIVAALVNTVPPRVAPESQDPLERLTGLVVAFIVPFSHWSGGRAVLAVHVQGQSDPELLELMVTRFWPSRAEALARGIADARGAGLIRADVSADTVRDLIFGPLTYRWLLTGTPITEDIARQGVQAALNGLRPPPSGAPA
jgi:AcrR family transcriptional regulator